MTPASLLLKVYYERLHERMAERRSQLLRRIDNLLAEELKTREFGDMDAEKVAAYREACEAFLDERLEMYNPIGVQYAFGNVPSHLAEELEFQLNWYDCRGEFEDLLTAARMLVAAGVSDEALNGLADDLIGRSGAFPNRSILAGYRAEPALPKLPDYIVACGIEEIVCRREWAE